MASVQRDEKIAPAILELAETRAIARSLRFAGYGVEYCSAEEVSHFAGQQVTPRGVAVRHPAFDITPHAFVTAIICERGVARPPYTESLRALVEAK